MIGKINLLLLLLLLVATQLEHISGAKILAVAFVSSKSHYLTYGKLLEELANRGHQLTIVNPLSTSIDHHRNVRRILTFDSDTLWQNSSGQIYGAVGKQQTEWTRYFKNPYLIFGKLFSRCCAESYKLEEVQNLRNETFDLIFFPPLFNDCLYGLIHELKTPTILYSQMALPPWVGASFGSPALPSVSPLVYYNFPENMNFGQRVLNLLGVLYFSAVREFVFEPAMERIYREALGQHLPSIKDIERNASLSLVNSNMNLVPPRPLTPDIIEVGGLYLGDPQPLPKDLQEFCDGATDGVILLSFGSILKLTEMPPEKLRIFTSVFSRLSQRVVLKWEDDEEPTGLPSNVKLSKWIPQPDVLGHKNTRLFITHGGHGGTSEALYAGVPMVGIPMFGDQEWNMEQMVLKGYALSLIYNELTEASLLGAINKVLEEPAYKQKVQLAAQLYRDQKESPLERAVYWVEYVIRHKGAVHLRSVGRHLNVFQFYSLDVIAFIVAIAFLISYSVFCTLGSLFQLVFCLKKAMKPSKRKRQ